VNRSLQLVARNREYPKGLNKCFAHDLIAHRNARYAWNVWITHRG